MRRWPSWAFLVGMFATVTVSAHGQARIDCSTLQSRILHRAVRYCVLLPGAYDSPQSRQRKYPVLYFLHGLGENEQTLFQSGGWNLIQDLRQEHKIGDFLIVAPQGWDSFFINSANGKVRYSDFFVREFIPHIERKYRAERDRRHRAITGVSMGGYGALRFAFADPDLFSAVSAQSAALITEPPRQVNAVERSGAALGGVLGVVFGDPINISHWQQNNPFALARQNRARLKTLAIYFNCGENDEYGFEHGAAALDRLLTKEGIGHEFHLYPGNHGLEYFLAHLSEVLEFHSRVFLGER